MNNLYCIITIQDKNIFYKFLNINNHFNKKKTKYIIKINKDNINLLNNYTKYNLTQIKYMITNEW